MGKKKRATSKKKTLVKPYASKSKKNYFWIILGIIAILLIISLVIYSLNKDSGETVLVGNALYESKETKANGEDIILNSFAETPISICTNITVSGEYALQNNLVNVSSSCFNILVDDVSFNGNGYFIDGNDAGNYVGISIIGRKNVTVKNINISDFNNGIYLFISNSIYLSNISVLSNPSIGISLDGTSSNNIISNVYASGSTNGISLGLDSVQNNLSNIIVTNNTVGIFLGYNANYNRINNATLINNYEGLQLFSSQFNKITNVSTQGNNVSIRLSTAAGYNSLTNLLLVNNTVGLLAQTSVGSNVISNIVAINNTNGLQVTGLSVNTNFSNILAYGNDKGIYLFGSYRAFFENATLLRNRNGVYESTSSSIDGTTYSNIVASNNFENGLYFFNTQGITLLNIFASNNSENGVKFDSSLFSLASNITALLNGNAGLYIRATPDSQFSNLQLTGNTDGLYLTSSQNATFVNIYGKQNTRSEFNVSWQNSDIHFINASGIVIADSARINATLSNISIINSTNLVLTIKNSTINAISANNVSIPNLLASGNIINDPNSVINYPLTICGNIYYGLTYKLMNNIFNYPLTCFNVLADNTVLDGNGYSIDGDDSSIDFGISISKRNNVTVKGFNFITDFFEGIEVNSSSNVTLSNLKVTSNILGIRLFESKNAFLVNISNVNNNFAGIYILKSNFTKLFNFTAINHSLGIFLDSSVNNVFDYVNASSNSQAIIFYNYSNHNLINNSVFNYNTLSALDFGGSLDINISNTISILNFYDLMQTIRPMDKLVLQNVTVKSYYIANKSLIRIIDVNREFNFIVGINGSGNNLFANSSSDIVFTDKGLYINPSRPGLNSSFNVTLDFTGIKVINPSILRNGVLCSNSSSPYCNIIYNAYGKFAFNATTSGNYTLNATFVDVCGDNVVDTDYGEVCDGSNFNGLTCSSYSGFNSGTLSCLSCSQISLNSCTYVAPPASSGGGGGGGGGGGAGKPITNVSNGQIINEQNPQSEETQTGNSGETSEIIPEAVNEVEEKPLKSTVYTVIIIAVIVIIIGLIAATSYILLKKNKVAPITYSENIRPLS